MPDLTTPSSKSDSLRNELRPMAADSARPSINEMATLKLDQVRFRRIVAFFTINFLTALWWEVVIKRIFGEDFVAKGREQRTRRYAKRFRALAIEMGGVMIKLGQFVSTRIDILPDYLVDELAGLQDEVPAVPFDRIEPVLTAELGQRMQDFDGFHPIPVAAASLGQVYRATLNGEKVIIKVQRPDIRSIVYTDLEALAVVARRAMWFRFISRRADVPELLEEFSAVLWQELDYIAEMNNAERFRAMFDDDDGIYVPQVYADYTTRRVIVEEDVTAIKLNDYNALEAAGINRTEVARRLLDSYLIQIFKERFFHADPHPGNIFVRPLRDDEAPPRGVNGRQVNSRLTEHGAPFLLIFIDYGMMGRLNLSLVEMLRQMLISLGLRDARTIVDTYEKLGLLMPGADKDRLIEAQRQMFDMVYGLDMDSLGDLSIEEFAQFGRDFQDLLFQMPFRIPQDLIYLGRCAGILSGMCTGLDAHFDPWIEMQPYVKFLMEGGRLDDDETHANGRLNFRDFLTVDNLSALLSQENLESAAEAGQDYLRRLLQLPVLAEDVLLRADEGNLQTRLKLDPELQARLDRMERHNRRMYRAMVLGSLAISGSILWRGRKDASQDAS